MTAPFRSDGRHHILPPEYVSALARIGITGGEGERDIRPEEDRRRRHQLAERDQSIERAGDG